MPRIQQLSPLVVAKIAAGEVIERPASVVKELLENSVDAKCGCITVEVENGGVDLIRIVDDGCGISEEELPLAFASHATSKLTSADDLFRIGTFGFRGEALCSIGGVAQVTLQSRVAAHDCGSEMTCHGGTLSPVRSWNGAAGTRVEVRHLFFNTPVRRKFLRTTATELGHIEEAVMRVALAHPDLHISLLHNDKKVFTVPGDAPLCERVALFFGREISDKLYSFDVRQGPARLRGLIAHPECDRGSAKLQYLFLNNRWIRDRSVSHAIQEGYRGMLMTGRYAVVVLFLDMPPDLVDVNVHPTKSEVRFRDSQAVYHLVLSGIRERLRAENLTTVLRTTPVGAAATTSSSNETSGVSWNLSSGAPPAPQLPFPARRTADPWQTNPANGSQANLAGASNEESELCASGDLPSAIANGRDQLAALKAMQIYDTYVVVETPEGMLVIDQHALHERMIFEHLKTRLQQGALETQRLLIPETVELTAEQSARVLECRAELEKLGLTVEEFSGGTLILTSYPALIKNRSPLTIFMSVVEHLVTKDRPPTREQMLHALLSVMACHAAVRSGDKLTPDQMAALVEQRAMVHDTHHCPHGRPTALLFSRQDLERQFRRV